MVFRLRINMDYPHFLGKKGEEVAWILRALADDIESGDVLINATTLGALNDRNENFVGIYNVTNRT